MPQGWKCKYDESWKPKNTPPSAASISRRHCQRGEPVEPSCNKLLRQAANKEFIQMRGNDIPRAVFNSLNEFESDRNRGLAKQTNPNTRKTHAFLERYQDERQINSVRSPGQRQDLEPCTSRLSLVGQEGELGSLTRRLWIPLESKRGGRDKPHKPQKRLLPRNPTCDTGLCSVSKDLATTQEILTAQTGGNSWRVPMSLHNATYKCAGLRDCNRLIVNSQSVSTSSLRDMRPFARPIFQEYARPLRLFLSRPISLITLTLLESNSKVFRALASTGTSLRK